ncbi:MAG: polyprenyl synthetase family protein [Bacteroidales bacterium]|jgi:octaprenyl-diphosphate synthase|nr:polyprenyl synthetase family protein [Bacteroidales bacterium]MDD4209977.1 polyprenyl synthetase family protein [Bacteroidales bacterium]MDY0016203.1 polyprenyl synthetase family protein [Bacteroidales bacterium]
MQKHIPISIVQEFIEFEKQYLKIFQNNDKDINAILNHLTITHGKCIRPILVLLSAGMTGKINKKTYLIATIIELLHMSSLVHDDVIDNASIRRNQHTVNSIWSNKISVLTGDYLLSKCMQILCELNDPFLYNYIGHLVNLMSEGELIQLTKINDFQLSEQDYNHIIEAKTAVLFAACMYLGAYSTTASKEDIACFEEIGKKIGMAFQIKDDLKDYDTNMKDKDFAKDIKEHIITLPLLYVLQTLDTSHKEELISLYKNHKNEDRNILKIINIIQNNGGVSYAESIIKRELESAMQLVKKQKNTIYKESLIEIIQQIA